MVVVKQVNHQMFFELIKTLVMVVFCFSKQKNWSKQLK
ncbi:hypothetical protein DESAMIL20_11 [Desulfurella amilsii]|uniref:Uncharacterized protein n=1 Tax=Desulfurella amilsii TaxID=1562698 RepID=A0A1X4XZH2_9BACT|nr:hypothetical protein DESAMIL20_11 [Desulfurella amilsii]